MSDPLVRNRGTMAGAVAHADPAADWPAAGLQTRDAVDVDNDRRGGN